MNLKIDTTNWQEFRVGDIFFKKKLKKFSSSPIESGNIPYISSTSANNGVSLYCNEESIQGNCITVSTNGKCFDCFYHKNPIAISSDVEVLYSDFLNEYNALFICTILQQEKKKWQYGRKPKKNKVFNTVIKLPVLLDNTPDWQFMENYIKAIVNKKRSDGLSLKEYIKTDNKHKETPLNTELWKMFKLSKLFDTIYKAKANKKNSIETFNKNNLNLIPLITRTDKNNGCDCYINKDDAVKIEKGNAIIIGDTTSTIYYQQNDFATGDHIVICRSSWMNKYNALFIRSILEKERFRYNYGRAFKMEIIKEMSIKLPQTKDGTPDWQFMENYIKSLPYGDKI